jgi:hypothetical protein
MTAEPLIVTPHRRSSGLAWTPLAVAAAALAALVALVAGRAATR